MIDFQLALARTQEEKKVTCEDDHYVTGKGLTMTTCVKLNTDNYLLVYIRTRLSRCCLFITIDKMLVCEA